MEKNTPARQILASLAVRYRFARTLYRNFKKPTSEPYLVGYLSGVEIEAWNAYQSAKRIYLESLNSEAETQ